MSNPISINDIERTISLSKELYTFVDLLSTEPFERLSNEAKLVTITGVSGMLGTPELAEDEDFWRRLSHVALSGYQIKERS